MAYRLIIRPEAEADISEAAVWYNAEESGLGAEFLEQVRSACIAPQVTRIYFSDSVVDRMSGAF